MRKATTLVYGVLVLLMLPSLVSAGTFQTRASGTVNWNASTTWLQFRTGTVSFTNGGTAVTGTGTFFLTELQVGDQITLQAAAGSIRGTVQSITNNTALTLTAGAGGGGNGAWGRLGVPATGDTVTIGNSAIGDLVLTYNVASLTLDSLSFEANGRAQTLVHTGTNALTINKTVNINQPTGGKTNDWQINAGSASVGGSLLLSGAATQTNRISKVTITTGSLSVAGSVIFNNAVIVPVIGVIDLSGGAAQLSIGGNLDLTNNAGTLTPGTTSTVTFNGTGAQTIEGGSSMAFSSLTVNKASGTATLTTNQVIGANLSVTAGTLDLAGFTANRTTSGGTLTASNGTTLKIGGTNTFPTNYSTVNLGATSTVEYSGTAQTVSNQSYGHLTLSNSGAKTMPGTTMAVAGNFTMNGTATATAAAAVNVTGNVAVNSGTTFNGGSFTHSVAGNWSAGGTFTPSTSTVTFNGTGSQSIGASPFNNLTIAKASGTASATGNLAVAGNLSVTSGTLDLSTFTANRNSAGGSLSLSASTTLKIGGTNTFPSNYSSVSLASASTVEYNGTTQSVSGQTYGHLTMSGGNTKTAAAGSVVNGTLSIGSGTTFNAGSFSHQVKGNWSNAGSFTASGSTVTLNGSSGQSVDASTFNNLTVSNSANATLLGNVGVDGALALSSGDLVTGAFTLTLGSSATISEASGATVLGTLATTRIVSQTTGTESFGGMGAVLTLHGTAPGSTSLTRSTGTASSGNGNTSILRKFAISPAVNTGLLADLAFTYDASELNGRTASALELYKSTDNGASWSNRGGVANAGLNKVTVSGLNGFSSWTASDPSNTLGAPPTPSLSGISPTSKSQGDSGFTLTVNGSDFVSGKSTVRFNGSDRTTTYVNENQLTAAISASDLYVAGAKPITVFTTGAGGSGSVDLTVNASTRSVTATASAGGVISPSGAVVVAFGTDTSFTATPNTGYHIDSLVVDGVNLGAVAGHTFSNVMTNHTINAYFSINVYTVTASASAGGSISPSGAVSVNYGAGQAFTVTPNTGYHIDSVVADGVNLGAVSGHTFSNVTANHTIAAYFSIDVFTVTATAGANGSISPSGAVSVNYGSSQAFTVTPNTGYHIDSVVADGVNLGAVAGHTFSNVTANHTVNAYFSINVYTLTSTTTAGGSISPSGVVNVNYGGSQAYTITPTTGFHIDSVVADGVNLGAVSGHTFSNVTANHTIDAYISIDVFTVTASASAGGSISPSGVVNVNYGNNQAFTVTPNTGYHIDSVLADGVNLGAVSGHTFSNVTANHTIDAYFSIDVFTVTAAAGANGSISPSGAVNVNYGGSQAYTVTPNTGYHIDSVVADGVNLGAVAGHTFSNVTANHTIDAYFSINVYTLTSTATAGGSISPSGVVNVNYGGSQAYTITSSTGYHIDSVLADGVNLGAVSGHTFSSVTANHTIDAYFSIDVFTVTATAGAGGSISPSGVVNVNYGDDQAFTVTPNTGYHIDSVLADGVNLGAVAGHTFSNVTANHTIDAYFSIDVFTVTASASAGGSISPSGAVSVNYGSNQSFTVTPNTGYHIDSVVVDGVNEGPLASRDFNSVTANHTVNAYFSINVYMLTSTATAGGSISPSGVVNVNYGGSQAYTITPNTGYHIDSVLADGVNLGAVSGHTFSSVTANHTIDAYFSIDVFTVTATAGAGGSISPSGAVNVNYGDDQAFSVTPNTGYHIDSVLADGVNLGAVAGHTFSNVTANHTIDAYFSIDVFTVTATAGAGGSISPSGVVNVNYGDEQAFTVTPNTGYHIDSVLADGVNLGAVAGHTFSNVTANHTIDAYFSIDVFTVTATAGAGGSISPSGVVNVNYGDDQAFSVTPNTGYHIDSVLADGVNLGAVAGHTLSNVTANHTIDAYFSIDVFTVTATAGAGGSISPSGVVNVNYGDDQAFTVTPNTGYHIDSVLADGVNLGAVAGHTFSNVTANHTIDAYFSIDVFTVTATAGAGGSISPSGVVNVNYGDDQAFTVTPNTGYHIDSVLADGVNLGAVAGHTFSNVTANHTIDAYFSIDVFTVTATAGAGGSISPSGVVNVNYGDDQAFTVTPNTGYHIDSVLADGVNLGAVTGHTFSNVTANHTIDAYFSIDVFTVTATAGAGGSISPSGVVNVNYGDDQAFTVTPNTGYHIDSVLADGVNLGAVAGHTFSNVTANHTIDAYFSIDVFTVTATAGAGGSISPSGVVNVNYGDDQAFTVTPNNGYHIDSVLADGVNLGAVSGHTFSNVTANHTIDAYFSIDVFTVTASASAGGSISPSGVANVNYGDDQAFTVTPSTGYHIDSVLADGVNLGAVSGHTFSNVSANHTIDAYFSINVYTLTSTASAGGSISPSGVVNINHGGSQAYTVTANTGYHIDSVLADGVNLGAVPGHTFSNVSANHTVDAYFSIDVFTVTATADAGGSISPSGVVNVNYGDDQAFTVTPNTGYHIDSVLADGVNLGAVSGHTFSNVTANHTIDAYFSIDVFTVTATAGANGSISPAGAVSVNYGAGQSFTVTPDAGYHIDSVVADGVNLGAVAGHDFTNVTANHSINAWFSINVYSIAASASAGGSISPTGSLNVNHGSGQLFTATPNTGYHLDSLVADGVNMGAVASHDFTNVTANHTIVAWFSVDVLTITASASAGGSISPSGPVGVNYGSNQSFTISPDAGYHIDSVVADGANLGAVVSHDFTNVTAGHSIGAYFSINVYSIAASASAGGSITPSGSVSVNHGSNQSFTATPNTGYHVDSIVVDGVNLGAAAGHNFMNVTSAHSINAWFSVDVLTITASASSGGSISPSGPVGVNYGANQSFTISPNAGYHIDSVVADGVNLGAVAGHSFTNVTANHTIAAYFSIDVLAINATASAGGSISPNGSVSVNNGSNQSFAIAANPGHHIDSVVADGVNLGAVASYLFTNVTVNHAIQAYFSINMYAIGATAGPGGSISPSGTVFVGSGGNQAFTITPDSGYAIDSVLVDEAFAGNGPSYTFTAVAAPHAIRAAFIQSAQTYIVSSAWNLLSVPQHLSDNRTAELFPQASAPVYTFGVNGYETADSVDEGAGYWVKLPVAQLLAIDGLPIRVDTIPVRARWNIVGSVSSPVAVDDVVQNPPGNAVTEFFGYDDGYSIADSILPGHAYWVRTATAGSLTLDGSGSSAAAKTSSRPSRSAELAGFNRLDIAPVTGGLRPASRSRGLWFGTDADGAVDPARFELPPQPPAGAFDARFGSQAGLAIVPDAMTRGWEMPLSISAAGAEVELSWTVRQADGVLYELVGRKGTSVTFRRSIAGEGTTRIATSDGTSYALAAATVPAAFSLAQNYPNPFNPSTTISFDLPEDSRVRLEVYNALGQLAATLIGDEMRTAGGHTVEFDAAGLPSGVYFYRIHAGSFTAMHKMVLMK